MNPTQAKRIPDAADIIGAVMAVVNLEAETASEYDNARGEKRLPVTLELMRQPGIKCVPVHHVRCISEFIVAEHVREWMGIEGQVPTPRSVTVGLWGHANHRVTYARRRNWLTRSMPTSYLLRRIYSQSLAKLNADGFSLHRYRK